PEPSPLSLHDALPIPTDYTVSLTLDSVSALSAAPVDPPDQVEGRVSDVDFHEAWTFAAQQGDAVSLRVVPGSRATLAPRLTLYADRKSTRLNSKHVKI